MKRIGAIYRDKRRILVLQKAGGPALIGHWNQILLVEYQIKSLAYWALHVSAGLRGCCVAE